MLGCGGRLLPRLCRRLAGLLCRLLSLFGRLRLLSGLCRLLLLLSRVRLLPVLRRISLLFGLRRWVGLLPGLGGIGLLRLPALSRGGLLRVDKDRHREDGAQSCDMAESAT